MDWPQDPDAEAKGTGGRCSGVRPTEAKEGRYFRLVLMTPLAEKLLYLLSSVGMLFWRKALKRLRCLFFGHRRKRTKALSGEWKECTRCDWPWAEAVTDGEKYLC